MGTDNGQELGFCPLLWVGNGICNQNQLVGGSNDGKNIGFWVQQFMVDKAMEFEGIWFQ